jgi:pimeloyl-ACP methyl ester carboxylesterase
MTGLFVLLSAVCVLSWSSRVQTTSKPTPDLSRQDTSHTARIETGRAFVNGIHIYYEVHGSHDGIPLVLLHGGGSTIDSNFGRLLPFLASARRVIALEEQGHGRTSDRDQPFTFEGSADDVAGLLRHLNVSQADLLGFSNGANVALQVAIRHPRLVRKLVFASSMTKRDGAHPQLWELIKQADIANMPQALKDAFLAVNPDSHGLRTMHDKDAARMAGFKDVPDAAVRGVRAPTLIVMGDRDVARLEHAIELSRLFPDARLVVLPGGHGDYLAEASSAPADTDYAEITARLVGRFLAAPQPHR